MSRINYVYKDDDAAKRGWTTTRQCAWALMVASVILWTLFLTH